MKYSKIKKRFDDKMYERRQHGLDVEDEEENYDQISAESRGVSWGWDCALYSREKRD